METIEIEIPTRYKYLFEDQDSIASDDLFAVVENMQWDYEELQKKFDDYKKNVEDNYKFIPIEEQIGWSENW